MLYLPYKLEFNVENELEKITARSDDMSKLNVDQKNKKDLLDNNKSDFLIPDQGGRRTMGIFGQVWEGRNQKKTLRFIENCNDETVLDSIVWQARYIECALAALNKITDQKILRKYAMYPRPEIMESAMNRLCSQDDFVFVIENAKNEDVKLAAVKHIQDKSIIYSLSYNAGMRFGHKVDAALDEQRKAILQLEAQKEEEEHSQISAALTTDSDRLKYLLKLPLTNQKERILFIKIVDSMSDPECLKKLSEHLKPLKKDDVMISLCERKVLLKSGYTAKQIFLSGDMDILDTLEKSEVIRGLSVDDFEGVRLTCGMLYSISGEREKDFIASILVRYADETLVKSLLSGLCESDRGASFLHILYSNNKFRDLIASANGTVMVEHKAEPEPVFDENKPEDREWLRGWRPDKSYRIVFMADADYGSEFIFDD